MRQDEEPWPIVSSSAAKSALEVSWRRGLEDPVDSRPRGAMTYSGPRAAGERVVDRLEPLVDDRPVREPVDVVRIDQRDRRAPRRARGVVEPLLELVDDLRVVGPAVARVAVGRRVGAAVEVVGLERRL